MTGAEALEWARLGVTLGQWLLGAVIQLADAARRSPEDVRRAEAVIPAPLLSTARLAAQRLVTQREIAAQLGLLTDARIAETSHALRSIGWQDAEEWARALHGLQPPPIVELPANPFEDAR